ncbi:hypothetical protein LWI29_023449 [Acer saccharum]|uniref:Uncharacterized protein n=1 Tax=Acer saccharum TaxID=4024 RepID=A0AA39VKY2_ACESA|nr:hypothetical protein LWI29_023449 [Acer saccharum]
MVSRYTNIQVNSVAALVNLSLEKINKGIVPPLIDDVGCFVGVVDRETRCVGVKVRERPVASSCCRNGGKTDQMRWSGGVRDLNHCFASEVERHRPDTNQIRNSPETALSPSFFLYCWT